MSDKEIKELIESKIKENFKQASLNFELPAIYGANAKLLVSTMPEREVGPALHNYADKLIEIGNNIKAALSSYYALECILEELQKQEDGGETSNDE